MQDIFQTPDKGLFREWVFDHLLLKVSPNIVYSFVAEIVSKRSPDRCYIAVGLSFIILPFTYIPIVIALRGILGGIRIVRWSKCLKLESGSAPFGSNQTENVTRSGQVLRIYIAIVCGNQTLQKFNVAHTYREQPLVYSILTAKGYARATTQESGWLISQLWVSEAVFYIWERLTTATGQVWPNSAERIEEL